MDKVVCLDLSIMERTYMRPLRMKITPRWTMYVHIMTEKQAKNHYETLFDITKIWRHKEFPLP